MELIPIAGRLDLVSVPWVNPSDPRQVTHPGALTLDVLGHQIPLNIPFYAGGPAWSWDGQNLTAAPGYNNGMPSIETFDGTDEQGNPHLALHVGIQNGNLFHYPDSRREFALPNDPYHNVQNGQTPSREERRSLVLSAAMRRQQQALQEQNNTSSTTRTGIIIEDVAEEETGNQNVADAYDWDWAAPSDPGARRDLGYEVARSTPMDIDGQESGSASVERGRTSGHTGRERSSRSASPLEGTMDLPARPLTQASHRGGGPRTR